MVSLYVAVPLVFPPSLAVPISIKLLGMITAQKKYFTYLQFPFLFLLLFFHPVYRLASLISLCTPLTTVLLLLRSIHLGWCFPLSLITMATAAVGRHWSLYNIPREAKAKTVDKKKKKEKEKNG